MSTAQNEMNCSVDNIPEQDLQAEEEILELSLKYFSPIG
jgi:hypothetical protein